MIDVLILLIVLFIGYYIGVCHADKRIDAVLREANKRLDNAIDLLKKKQCGS